MKWNNLLPIFALIFSKQLIAQVTLDYSGTEAAGLGGASVLSENVWAVRNNPALLASLQHKQIAADHARLYANSGLSASSVAMILPYKNLTWGAFTHQGGYSGFRYLQTGVAVGKRLNEKLELGIQLSYASFDFGDRFYGKWQYLNSSAGTSVKLPKNVRVAVVIHNLHRPLISSSREAMSFKAGISYPTSKNTSLMAEATQIAGAGILFRLGMEYRYQEKFIFRAGIADQADYGQMCFGFGMKHKNLNLNIAAGWHPLLGLTPHTGLRYVFP